MLGFAPFSDYLTDEVALEYRGRSTLATPWPGMALDTTRHQEWPLGTDHVQILSRRPCGMILIISHFLHQKLLPRHDFSSFSNDGLQQYEIQVSRILEFVKKICFRLEYEKLMVIQRSELIRSIV